jgi:hypothetical protein
MDKKRGISFTYIVDSIKNGKNPSQIAKDLNTSKQRINYYIAKAKVKGLIKRDGLVWEIDPVQQSKNLSQADKTLPDSIRGHALIWKVQFKHKYNWKELLNNLKINYDEMGITQTPRIILNNKKIWLGKKNIIVYEPESMSFYGQNAIECRKLAVYSLLDTLKLLEQSLSIKINEFKFTPNREHFSMIKNALAEQCNKNNEKINVFNEKGLWLSIDNSFNLNELETLGTMSNQPLETNLRVQKWWNDNKATDFKVTPTFLLESLNKITQNQLYESTKWAEYGHDIVEHKEAIKKLGNAVEDLTKLIKELNGNK